MKPMFLLSLFTVVALATKAYCFHSIFSMVESFQPMPTMIPMKQRNPEEIAIKMQLSSSSSTSNISRRRVLEHIDTLFKVSTIAIFNPFQAQAIEEQIFSSTATTQNIETINKVILKGIVALQPGTQIETSSESTTNSPALYITARPNKADNVPKAILDGSRGKPPPVLIARYPLSPNDTELQFPFEFTLTEQDLTIEGQSQWFLSSKDDLIISARLDLDGIAATRDPGDLVGRGIYLGNTLNNSGNEGVVKVQLQGRGIGGKFVTKKAK